MVRIGGGSTKFVLSDRWIVYTKSRKQLLHRKYLLYETGCIIILTYVNCKYVCNADLTFWTFYVSRRLNSFYNSFIYSSIFVNLSWHLRWTFFFGRCFITYQESDNTIIFLPLELKLTFLAVCMYISSLSTVQYTVCSMA